ncbi:MAG TPA: hypothetical protein VG318_04970 [Actinomycetota bacterium]|nr:hypothetical protein [Actinomycetota bacterium]
MHRHVMGLMALVVGVAFGVSPTPALAQVGQPVVQHDTYVQDDPGRAVAASCVASAVVTGSSMTVVVAGSALAPGPGIRVGCGIVQGGRVVRSFTNAVPGSLAATAGMGTLSVAPYRVCLNLYVSFIDGSEVRYNGCPV